MPDPVALVIFDCDGVLVDSERLAVKTNIAVGAELGWPITDTEVIEQFIGRSAVAIAEIIAARVGLDRAAAWASRFAQLHHAAMDVELTPVEGIAEALDRITLPTCVASSGTHDKMRRTLGRTRLYERFAGRIFSASDVVHGKPAPDLFLYAATTLGAAPGECVVVEDSPFGVQAARAAGMRCLGYAGGVVTADRLAGRGAMIFDDMRALPSLLELI